jgi:hypothetical protein
MPEAEETRLGLLKRGAELEVAFKKIMTVLMLVSPASASNMMLREGPVSSFLFIACL